MLAEGDVTASQSLEVTRHGREPLLELLLAPMMSSLTFVEVVECILNENWCSVELSLDDLQGQCAWLQGELDDLIEAHRKETIKPSRKKIKKEIDLRQKDLESLRFAISEHESSLRRARDQQEPTTISDDDSSDHGTGNTAEAEMAVAPAVNDAPSGGTMTQSSDPPPVIGQTGSMEVDDEDEGPPPASPVSPREDDLLTGSGVIGVEGEMANLTVSSPSGHEGGGQDASA